MFYKLRGIKELKMLAIIKFSHKYLKLTGIGDKAILLQVIKTNYSDLSPSFIDFDTKYFADGTFKNFEIPQTELILLIFKNVRNKLFITLRRHTPNKFSYYKKKEGQFFKVMIENALL